MGKVQGRKRKRIGPVVLNMASTGWFSWRVTSWGIEVGRWSWNSRTDRHRLDLPGPWSWMSGGGRDK